MSLTVNLYYTGINGNAKKFADEMECSGIADAIRAEKLKHETPDKKLIQAESNSVLSVWSRRFIYGNIGA